MALSAHTERPCGATAAGLKHVSTVHLQLGLALLGVFALAVVAGLVKRRTQRHQGLNPSTGTQPD